MAACSAAACFSFGDLSGGAGDDNTSSDSGSDASLIGDGQSGGDSSIGDAVSDSTSDSASFCLSDLDATFCADFDESTDAMAGFSSLYLNDGGVNGLDEEFSSSPRAFFSGNRVLGSGTSAHAALVRTTGITPTRAIHLAFDIRVDSLDTAGKQIEALAIVNNSSTRSSLQMNLKAASSEVGEEIVALDGGTSYYPHVFSTKVPVGSYVHLDIVMSFNATSRNVKVTVDGSTVVQADMNAAFVTGPVDLYLGNAYAPGPSSGATIHYDNVSLTVE